MSKVCSKCKLIVPVGKFNKCKASSDGLRSECRDCCRADCARRYLINREARIKYAKEYNKEHAEIKTKYGAEYNASHRDVTARNNRNWELNNHERRLALNNEYRARKLNALVEPIPEDYWQQMLDFYGVKCMYPGCSATEGLTRDHIVPLSKGGTHSLDNLQILCRPHNSGKCNHHATDYRPEMKLETR